MKERRLQKVIRKLTLLCLSLSISLTACSLTDEETAPIRVGVLPVLDTLPLFVAQDEGFFSNEGIEVEFVPVNAAPERDQLMQSGQIDAMLNEIVSVILFNQEQTRIVAVRFLRVATETTPVFRIVAAAGSGIETVEDLKNVPIGVSEGTVIEYTTDRILQNAGVADTEIAKIAVPKIPDRLNLLASGQLQAANLPDPAASLAILNGAQLVIDDRSYPAISHSVLSFSRSFLDDHPQTVRRFLQAIEQAVLAINADKGGWTSTLTENNLIPPPLLDSYALPDYPLAGVPTESQFQDALNWLQDYGLVEIDLMYDDSIDASYLP